MANIIVGKFGKSISFNFNKWGMIGGDSESAIFIASLAQLYPHDNFYIVSRNDFSSLYVDVKEKINKNNNLFDCWETFKKGNKQDWLSKYFKMLSKVTFILQSKSPKLRSFDVLYFTLGISHPSWTFW